jgi:hypothetical protein
MTIDQILIKTEGIKKDTSALSSEVKALKMLSMVIKERNSSIERVLKEFLSKDDYDDYLETKDELSKVSKLNLDSKAQLTAFNLAYFLKEVAASANEGLVLGITAILRTVDPIDRIKVNELVKIYKEDQSDQTTLHFLQQAFINCSSLLATKQGAEEAIASLYVLYSYIIKIIIDIREDLADNIDEMLDHVLQQAVETFNSLN